MRGGLALLAVLCACKAEIGVAADPDGATGDGVVADAPSDAFGTFGPWSAPTLVPGLGTAVGEDDGTLSNSKLELVYAKADPAIDGGRKHLYLVTRPSDTSAMWSAPVAMPFDLDGTSDETPRFSADDKKLYFGSNRPGTTGGLDIWEVTRPAAGSMTWGTPSLVAGVNSTATDKWCVPCNGNRYLLVSSRAPSTSDDLWEGVLGGGPPTLVASLSTANSEIGAFLTKDCLTAYFASNRPDGVTTRIYTSTRAAVTDPWPAPTVVDDFAALGGSQEDPWLSDDGKTFVFAANTGTGKDIYITTR